MAIDAGLDRGSCPYDPDTYACLGISSPPLAYRVVPGGRASFVFTLLNLGTAPAAPNVRLLLTTQNDPTPSSFTVLDSWTPTLDPNTPYEIEREVTIPNGTSPSERIT